MRAKWTWAVCQPQAKRCIQTFQTCDLYGCCHGIVDNLNHLFILDVPVWWARNPQTWTQSPVKRHTMNTKTKIKTSLYDTSVLGFRDGNACGLYVCGFFLSNFYSKIFVVYLASDMACIRVWEAFVQSEFGMQIFPHFRNKLISYLEASASECAVKKWAGWALFRPAKNQ